MSGHRNAGYRRLVGDDLSVGLFAPLAGADTDPPRIDRELALARRAESLGVDAIWARDVPTYWPTFGDAGQVYDPWVYLSALAAVTDDVALATGGVVLSVRHPLHVAASAASLDRASGGRLVLGVGSGDRDPEYAAFGVDPDDRGTRFREAVAVVRTVWGESFPEDASRFGTLDGTVDPLPRPESEVPVLVTGHARQDLDWIADHADGWLFYQLPRDTLEGFLADWRAATDAHKPFVMGLTLELAADPDAGPAHVHQGFRAGADWVRSYLRDLREAGVDHVAVSLRGDRDPEATLEAFAGDVLGPL
ncbi:MAG: TIGR03571 family LLM class oxidoreductase [Halobacteriaceae archaeon]